MKKLLCFLPLLAGCGQNTTEQQATEQPASPQTRAATHVPAAPDTAYTSGDRTTSGPLDTLHVGRGLVLRLVPGSKKDFARAPRMTAYQGESVYLAEEPAGQIRRNGKTLILTLANGKKLELTDNNAETRGDENEATGYRYEFHGTLKRLPYWQVDSLVYEGAITLLINKSTGIITRLWSYSYPALSPSNLLIAANSEGLETGMALNGLQLLAVSNLGITPRWSRILRSWEPYRIHWLDDKTLAIEQRRFPATASGQENLSYVRLLLPH